MKQYQYILLDWDGNLAKTLGIWLEMSRKVLSEHGYQLAKEDIGVNFTQPLEFYQSLGLADPQAVLQRRQILVLERLPKAELYPDALEVLAHLKDAGKNLALVSSSPRQAILPALTRHGLTSTFEIIVTGDDVNHHKPDPEPLEIALAGLSGTKELAIMIGDTAADVICAKRFGIDSIAFMPPEHAEFYHFDVILKHQPTHTITNFRQVMDIIT